MFDPVAELQVAVKEVAAEDRVGWGGLALADRVLGLSQASERLLVEVVRALAAWDGEAACALDGALALTGWLVHRLPVTEAEARGLVKIAALYRRHDCVAAALDGGEIGVAHARVMKNAAAGRDDAFTACAPGLVGLARDHPLVKDFAQVMAEWMRLVDDREPHDDAGRAFRVATTFGGTARTEISGSADDAEIIRAAIEAYDPPDSPDCPEGPRTRAQRHYDIAMDIFARALADRLGTDPDSTGTADVIVDADTVAELLRDPDVDDDGQDPLDEFFDRHGIADYRIVESAGATEGAPAAGAAELIVDITTTGATLAANALKVLDDGVIMKSEAHLVASRTANWSGRARDSARDMLDRIAAQARARESRDEELLGLEALARADGKRLLAGELEHLHPHGFGRLVLDQDEQ
ncbi:MAG TPA: hypothetical protein PKA98_12400, partial [Acidimicrobiales bacterium]|nr:hypothetical protein [Acidimicrobiales bacterium]